MEWRPAKPLQPQARRAGEGVRLPCCSSAHPDAPPPPPQLRQAFERFDAPSAAGAAGARLAHFKARVWPRLQERAAGGGLLLVVPQYFDFVRLRCGVWR
jgi:hypothetical protein